MKLSTTVNAVQLSYWQLYSEVQKAGGGLGATRFPGFWNALACMLVRCSPIDQVSAQQRSWPEPVLLALAPLGLLVASWTTQNGSTVVGKLVILV